MYENERKGERERKTDRRGTGECKVRGSECAESEKMRVEEETQRISQRYIRNGNWGTV